MFSESTVATRIRTALAQRLKRDPSKVQPGHDLRADLGLDSLAMIELLFKIEEEFDLNIPNHDLSKITTVSDVVAYVEERLESSAPASRAVVSTTTPAAAVTPAPKVSKRSAAKKKGSRRA